MISSYLITRKRSLPPSPPPSSTTPVLLNLLSQTDSGSIYSQMPRPIVCVCASVYMWTRKKKNKRRRGLSQTEYILYRLLNPFYIKKKQSQLYQWKSNLETKGDRIRSLEGGVRLSYIYIYRERGMRVKQRKEEFVICQRDYLRKSLSDLSLSTFCLLSIPR